MISRLSLASSLLALSLAASSCSKPAPKFHRVDLSKDDIVSLFDVQLDENRLGKFEWQLGREHYVRTVIERSDDPGRTWREHAIFTRDLAVVTATFIYKFDPTTTPASAPASTRYLLRTRLGGRGIGTAGWTESSTLLDFPAGNMRWESQFTDPDRVLIISSGDRAYRIRLEAAEKPWGKR